MININDISKILGEGDIEINDGGISSGGITVGGGRGSGAIGGGGYNPGTGGGYNYLPSDPTFTSGNLYAQSIAGGQNVPNMIAPGMSYSAANPQGYTQEDIRVRSPGGPGAGYVPTPPRYRNPMEDKVYYGGSPTFDESAPPKIFDDFISIGGRGTTGDFGGFENIMYPGGNSSIYTEGPTFDSGDKVYPGGSSTFDESAIPFKGSQYQPLDLSGIQSILDGLKGTFQPDLSGYAKLDEIPQFDINDYRDNITSIAKEGIDIPTYESPNIDDLIARLDVLEKSKPPVLPPVIDDSGKKQKPVKIIGGF
jgi:hypothetical protein